MRAYAGAYGCVGPCWFGTDRKHSRPFLSPSMAGRTACGAVWVHSLDVKVPNMPQEQEHRGVCFKVDVV